MSRRSSITVFVVLGLGVALMFAFFVSPLASSEPDGLERVAIDQGFEGQAETHAMAGGPLADYAVTGVDNSWLSTGLSGVIGVVLCFLVGAALILVIRAVRSRGRSDTSTPAR